MRATNYRSKPSEEWSQNAEQLAQTRLFLVAKNGPSVFQLKDEAGDTYKIVLGNPHKCTCQTRQSAAAPSANSLPTVGNTCIHILFCLIKVLRVSKTHPLCYQSSLTDSELDQVLSGQCCDRPRQISILRRSLIRSENTATTANTLTTAASTSTNDTSIGSIEQKDGGGVGIAGSKYVPQKVIPGHSSQEEAEEEQICAICHDIIEDPRVSLVPLTWCRFGCGQNYHASCMMICYSHHQEKMKQSQSRYYVSTGGGIVKAEDAMNCPLCREPWDVQMLKLDCLYQPSAVQSSSVATGQQLTRSGQQSAAAVAPTCIPIRCVACKNRARRLFHRCLECTMTCIQQRQKGTTAGNNNNSSSSSSAAGSNSSSTSHYYDLCGDCYERLNTINNQPTAYTASRSQFLQEHTGHHFLTSDATTESIKEVVWQPILPSAAASASATGSAMTLPMYRMFTIKQTISFLLDAFPMIAGWSQSATGIQAGSGSGHLVGHAGMRCWSCGQDNHTITVINRPRLITDDDDDDEEEEEEPEQASVTSGGIAAIDGNQTAGQNQHTMIVAKGSSFLIPPGCHHAIHRRCLYQEILLCIQHQPAAAATRQQAATAVSVTDDVTELDDQQQQAAADDDGTVTTTTIVPEQSTQPPPRRTQPQQQQQAQPRQQHAIMTAAMWCRLLKYRCGHPHCGTIAGHQGAGGGEEQGQGSQSLLHPFPGQQQIFAVFLRRNVVKVKKQPSSQPIAASSAAASGASSLASALVTGSAFRHGSNSLVSSSNSSSLEGNSQGLLGYSLLMATGIATMQGNNNSGSGRSNSVSLVSQVGQPIAPRRGLAGIVPPPSIPSILRPISRLLIDTTTSTTASNSISSRLSNSSSISLPPIATTTLTPTHHTQLSATISATATVDSNGLTIVPEGHRDYNVDYSRSTSNPIVRRLLSDALPGQPHHHHTGIGTLPRALPQTMGLFQQQQLLQRMQLPSSQQEQRQHQLEQQHHQQPTSPHSRSSTRGSSRGGGSSIAGSNSLADSSLGSLGSHSSHSHRRKQHHRPLQPKRSQSSMSSSSASAGGGGGGGMDDLLSVSTVNTTGDLSSITGAGIAGGGAGSDGGGGGGDDMSGIYSLNSAHTLNNNHRTTTLPSIAATAKQQQQSNSNSSSSSGRYIPHQRRLLKEDAMSIASRQGMSLEAISLNSHSSASTKVASAVAGTGKSGRVHKGASGMRHMLVSNQAAASNGDNPALDAYLLTTSNNTSSNPYQGGRGSGLSSSSSAGSISTVDAGAATSGGSDDDELSLASSAAATAAAGTTATNDHLHPARSPSPPADRSMDGSSHGHNSGSNTRQAPPSSSSSSSHHHHRHGSSGSHSPVLAPPQSSQQHPNIYHLDEDANFLAAMASSSTTPIPPLQHQHTAAAGAGPDTDLLPLDSLLVVHHYDSSATLLSHHPHALHDHSHQHHHHPSAALSLSGNYNNVPSPLDTTRGEVLPLVMLGMSLVDPSMLAAEAADGNNNSRQATDRDDPLSTGERRTGRREHEHGDDDDYYDQEEEEEEEAHYQQHGSRNQRQQPHGYHQQLGQGNDGDGDSDLDVQEEQEEEEVKRYEY